MELTQLQNELRKMAVDHIDQALERLIDVLDAASTFYNEALQLQGRLKELRRNERLGVITNDEIEVRLNRIRAAYLDIVNALEKHDIQLGVLSESDQPLLDQLLDPPTIKQLIKDLEPEVNVASTLYYVNCNRENSLDYVFDFFADFYDQQKPYQFYFFSACSTQRAKSFSERMVYEIEGYLEDLDELDQAFRYWPTPKDERVTPFELPVGRNLRTSQIKFKKLLGEKLEFTGNHTIESYLKTGQPVMDYKAIAMSFVYRETDWKDFIPDYFQWIVETFSKAKVQADCPTFLFFFAIDVMDIHSIPPEELSDLKRKIFDELESLVSANVQSTVHLSRLMPVHKKEVKAWLTKLGTDNDAMQERLIQLMVSQQTLSKKDRQQYIRDQRINMDDIELFQKWLLQYADKKGGRF